MSGAALRVDVLVVGGGLAGAVAALSARRAGATVALTRRAPGASALYSGAVSVAPDVGATPGTPFAARRGPLDAARHLAALRPEHPYARVGEGIAALSEALAFAAAELPFAIALPSARQAWIATPHGTVLPCAACQPGMLPGDLGSAGGLLAVVAPRGHLAWDARLVAEGVERCAALGGPHAAVIKADLFTQAGLASARPHELARSLEPPGAAERAGEALRRVLPVGILAAVLPPVLGLSPGARVQERMSAAAGVRVAETLSDVPSVPGLRLQAAIDARLREVGVIVVAGALEDARGPGQAARAGGREVAAAAWILATGRFIGGGIARHGALVETVLGLPVAVADAGTPGARLAGRPAAQLTARERRAPQPLLSAGLRIDAACRPLGEHGEPAHPRLFAAGAVVGGHDQADGTGLGVAILTGFLAGQAAVR